jgi:adenylosuccinate synthase
VLKSGADENEKTEVHHVKRAVMNITNYFCAFGFFFINITVQGISLFMVSQYSFRTVLYTNIHF